MLCMTLPDNTPVLYKSLLPLSQLIHLMAIVQEGRGTCGDVFSTNLGISLSSVLVLVGVDDAEEHSVPSVKAGHMYCSVLQFWYKSSFISYKIFMFLKAVFKSRTCATSVKESMVPGNDAATFGTLLP